MNTGLKIYKLDIDEDNLNSGVDAIALVQSPAMEEDFYLFSKQQPHMFESFADYPESVSNNAKRGIELNEKVNNKCATQVGKVRAQQLANKEAISVETIKRMYSYLSRAEEYYDESDSEACGTISYLLWGGLAAKRWSESKLKELGLFEGAIDVSSLPDYSNEPSGSLIVKDIYQSMEIDVFGYKTKYFYICPGAISTFEDLTSLELDEDVVGMIRSAAQIADNVFLIEKNAIESGKTSQEELDEAILLVDDFQDLIREIEQLVGRRYNTSYMDNHIITIRSYLKDVFVENAGGFSVGDYVSWTFAGRGDDTDRARGQITDLRVSGEVNVPNTDVTLTATEERPVALIKTIDGTIVGQYVDNLRQTQKPEGFVDPRAGEGEDDFIGRCIPKLLSEGYDQEQAAAICYSSWRDRFNEIEKIGDYFEELFSLLGHLDGIPVYSTPQEAMQVAEVAGCMGYHSHMLGDMIVYMPCEEHDAAMDALLGELYEEYKKKKGKYISDLPQGTQDKIVDALMKVGEKYNEDEWAPMPEKFAIESFPRETSIEDTLGIKIRYRYKGPRDSKNRSFCRRMLDANLLFRKEDINNLTLGGENIEFGIYDIFTYKGSYGCRHNWERVYKRKDDDGKTINIKEVAADAATSVNAKPTAGRNPNSETLIINQFAEQQREQQIVIGPILIPDKLIYRWDEIEDSYYVYFSADTIKKIAYKYMEQRYVDQANIEHDPEQMLKNVYLVESWIVDNPATDKSKALTGNEYPKGTWMGTMRIKNKRIWEDYIKTGLVKGFSAEGYFVDQLVSGKSELFQ
jgi:hypothetical protein